MTTMKSLSVPHPFPYQGSKRGIAHAILNYFPTDVQCLIEPFCGSGAVSIAAATQGLAKQFVLNDLNKPLMDLWRAILEAPNDLSNSYERQWLEQQPDLKSYFFKVRDAFNQSAQAHQLLYLLARIVKGAVRYNSEGKFNQSADNRRAGMRPNTMRQNLLAVSALLNHRTLLSASDFRETLSMAKPQDLVYLDPPYQGTSFTRDSRYLAGISYAELVERLYHLNTLDISYLLSYDGVTGTKVYGKPLPLDLELKHVALAAGRSSQATLLGNKAETIESLYLSPALVKRLKHDHSYQNTPHILDQQSLVLV
ncbi:Dam family site-specific DNA-(adenine-N6)-methyltransferase [Thiolinea disciformis]|uniref:Dam family site-specific DNA-(adenine-N6)-methyltransferase n=1 Tax=Thiolinea disciformis TaxID=125614 RepID=UPI0003A62E6D|nr:DNA adenine methylase [Thiolinea disciformis]